MGIPERMQFEYDQDIAGRATSTVPAQCAETPCYGPRLGRDLFMKKLVLQVSNQNVKEKRTVRIFFLAEADEKG